MIYLSKFLLDNITIKLRTNDPIDEKTIIQKVLDNFNYNLNHNLEGSLAYRFNDLRAGERMYLPNYFIKFIKTNIGLSKGYDFLFSPFLPIEISQKMEEILKIGKEGVEKKIDCVLDTSYLRKPFLLDAFCEFLNVELGIDSFLVEMDNYFFAKGEKEWIIAHEMIPGTYGIKDECLLIEEYEVAPKNQYDINSYRIIISADSACIDKIEYSILPELHNKKEFQKYSEMNSLRFIVLDREKKYYQFPD